VGVTANLPDYKTRMPAFEGVLDDDEIVAVLPTSRPIGRMTSVDATTSSTNGTLTLAADRSCPKGQHPADHAVAPNAMPGSSRHVQCDER
jgi:hypothetical protein